MTPALLTGIGAAVTCLNKLTSAVSGNRPPDFRQCLEDEAKKLRETSRTMTGEQAQKLTEMATRMDRMACQPSVSAALAAYQAFSR